MNTRLAPLILVFGLASGAAQAALFDRGGGLIYDDTLNLTWLQDANQSKTNGDDADGLMTWDAAIAWADQLVYAGYSDWRLPGVAPLNGVSFDYAGSNDGHTDGGWNITRPSSELAHMFYVSLGNQGARTSSGASSSCGASNLCLTNTGPFINLTPGYGSWYGQEFWGYGYLGYAWAFDSGGYQSGYLKNSISYAWAVHPGDIAAVVPEPETYALLLAGLGLVGVVAKRRRRIFGASRSGA